MFIGGLLDPSAVKYVLSKYDNNLSYEDVYDRYFFGNIINMNRILKVSNIKVFRDRMYAIRHEVESVLLENKVLSKKDRVYIKLFKNSGLPQDFPSFSGWIKQHYPNVDPFQAWNNVE